MGDIHLGYLHSAFFSGLFTLGLLRTSWDFINIVDVGTR